MNLVPVEEDSLEKYLFTNEIISDAKASVVEQEHKSIIIDPVPLSAEEFVYGEPLLVE